MLISQLGRGLKTGVARTLLAIGFAAALATFAGDPATAQTGTGDRARPPAAAPQKPVADDATALKATGKVTLGYVTTGDASTDDTSRQGLLGLNRVLTQRTAVEPGEPVGIDIVKDEIAFYPVLYWPVLASARALPAPTLAKIDAYMKQGGMIVFDTRDFQTGLPSGTPGSGQGGAALQS